jgi:integrase
MIFFDRDRCQELGSLTPESFSLDGAEPTLRVGAAYSKHRREDILPLRDDLAKLLREYLSTKEPVKPIWPGRWVIKGAKMMRGDLAAARAAWIKEASDETDRKERLKSDLLAYENADGEMFDFHAQRGQMITALEQANIPLKTLQALARHSRVETTLRHYSRKPRLADTRAALDNLPPLPGMGQEGKFLRATGTEATPRRLRNACALGDSTSDGLTQFDTRAGAEPGP